MRQPYGVLDAVRAALQAIGPTSDAKLSLRFSVASVRQLVRLGISSKNGGVVKPHIAWMSALVLAAAAMPLAQSTPVAATDSLGDWNDGAAKRAIVGFVQTTTDPSSSRFVPPAERVAVFDQDGTLWVERPIYAQLVYCLDRVPAVVKTRPQLASEEPFKTVLTANRAAIAPLNGPRRDWPSPHRD